MLSMNHYYYAPFPPGFCLLLLRSIDGVDVSLSRRDSNTIRTKF